MSSPMVSTSDNQNRTSTGGTEMGAAASYRKGNSGWRKIKWR